jgi:uncharacterized protein (TIGR02466 family)
MALHTELWFPSVVWSGIVHKFDNKILKEFAYAKKQQDNGVVISNYGGWQSNSIRANECDELDGFVDYLNKEIADCSSQVGISRLELYNIWININPPGSYNHLHNHLDAVLSGVYYVHAEDGQGNIQFERSDGAEYHLPQQVAKLTYFNATRTTYRAKTGALYVFPGWLKHSVQGNASTEDRISISFNYGEKK